MQKTYNRLIKGIKKYFEQSKIKKAVIGLSGGIDSAVSLRLVADAIGSKNIVALIMPEIGLTKKENIDDAISLAKKLKVDYKIIEINDFFAVIKKSIKWEQNKNAIINTKARIRAVILYNYANTHNALVVGTSNKSEVMLGYFTKYGDGAVDIEVIEDLFKTDVIKLAKYLKLPKDIINKKPSAELYHGHTDEKELGASYDEIDEILKKIAKKKELNKGDKLTNHILDRINKNKHKLDLPVIIK